MFDIIAKLLSSLASFLFPVFASYKALKTSDPALITPWLMYWVVLAIALLMESWAEFILVWIPFYPWIRLGFFLWLVLPTTQGARVLYLEHVDPFLHEHEVAIEDFISTSHDRAKTAGLTYLRRGVDLLKQHVLGIAPEPTPPPSPSTRSYAQQLMARFSMPIMSTPSTTNNANTGANTGATAADFYNLLASAVSAATSSSILPSQSANPSREPDLSNSGMLVPPTLQETEERISWIAAQRERLAIVLSALDREASTLRTQSADGSRVATPRSVSSGDLGVGHFPGGLDDSTDISSGIRPASAMSGLSKSRSEDFETIDRDVVPEDRPQTQRGGSWLPWSWGASSSSASTATVTPPKGDDLHMVENEARGVSTGIDI